MLVQPFQRPRLRSQRDNRILMHTCRNGVTTQEVLHGLYFQDCTVDACRKAIVKLHRQGYLSKYPMWDNKSLYRIGPRAVSAFGWPEKRSKRLGAQRLPYEIGCLAFTHLGDAIRKRLLPHEIQVACPNFPSELVYCWAYIKHEQTLSTVRVEPRCASPKKVIQKLSEQLYRYRKHPALDQLVQAGEFRFAVIVSTEAQEFALQEANEEAGFSLPLETSHYPELIRFM